MLAEVMWNSNNLIWIDLSYNILTKIEDEILNFPHLKTLYLHKNYISNLEEVKKLKHLENLQSLTLYGNDIEQVKGYRLFVLGIMYEQSEQLRKLDQVYVTKKEFDDVLVWNERLHKSDRRRLKKLEIKNKRAIPQPPTEEEEKQT